MTDDNVPSSDPLRNPREEGLALAKQLRDAAAVALEQAERIEALASRPRADEACEILFAQGPATAASPRAQEVALPLSSPGANEARIEYYDALDLVVMALVGRAGDPDAVDARSVAQQLLVYAAMLAGGFDPESRPLITERVRRAYHSVVDIATNGSRQIAVLRILDAFASDAAPDERTALEVAGWASTYGPPDTPRASPQALMAYARAALLAWAGEGNLKKWEAANDFLRELGLASASADALERAWQRRPVVRGSEIEGQWVEHDDGEGSGG